MDFTKAKTFDPESIVQDAIFTVLMLTTQKCGKWNTSFIYLTISENANNSRYSNESGKQQRPQQQEKKHSLEQASMLLSQLFSKSILSQIGSEFMLLNLKI